MYKSCCMNRAGLHCSSISYHFCSVSSRGGGGGGGGGRKIHQPPCCFVFTSIAYILCRIICINLTAEGTDENI